jgi:Winged helix DNA-binding domain
MTEYFRQMTLTDISNLRLDNQRIAATEFKTALEIVEWMGAMQAQDYAMAKWAVGLRLNNSTDEMVEAALAKGEIFRIHLMRPTWHFISAKDIYWMIELTKPQVKSFIKSRHRELELSDPILSKSYNIIGNALLNGLYLTREDLAQGFEKAKIRTDGNRLSHILHSAELEGIICSGPRIRGKHSYALLSERVPIKKILSREESIAELTKRYFKSHCPATLYDFTWWSGLSVKDAGRGLESLKPEFVTETINSKKYWFPNSFTENGKNESSVRLLPAYDEFLISYRDRSASLLLVDDKRTISSNGVFYPVVIENGNVVGLWRRTINKSRVFLEIEMFNVKNKNIRHDLEKGASLYGHFLNKEIELKYKD